MVNGDGDDVCGVTNLFKSNSNYVNSQCRYVLLYGSFSFPHQRATPPLPPICNGIRATGSASR